MRSATLLFAVAIFAAPLSFGSPRANAHAAHSRSVSKQVARQQAGLVAERERLLNGLSFFIVPQPGSPQVSVLLRFHSGAAFDLAGKEGMTALLARALFPDATTRTYVEEELGGKLDVTYDYDKIELRISGRADAFETIIELIRNALLTNPTIDAKALDALRAHHLTETEADGAQGKQSTLAARAAARRLFGTYPLGRLATGTPESLARVTRPDLLLARERFLAPNNATMVIVGNVAPGRARLALRQYLGAWRMSDTRTQATFRQPLAPQVVTFIVPASETDRIALRLAARAPARPDRDHAAASILTAVLRERLSKISPAGSSAANLDVRYDAYKLAGVLTISATATPTDASRTLAALRDALQTFASAAPPSSSEIERARTALLLPASSNVDSAAMIATLYLDADTYGAADGRSEAQLRAVTPTDVQRLAARLFSTDNIVGVAAGDAAKLEAELTRAGVKYETPGTEATAQAPPTPTRVPGRTNGVPTSPLVPQPAATTPPPPAKRP